MLVTSASKSECIDCEDLRLALGRVCGRELLRGGSHGRGRGAGHCCVLCSCEYIYRALKGTAHTCLGCDLSISEASWSMLDLSNGMQCLPMLTGYYVCQRSQSRLDLRDSRRVLDNEVTIRGQVLWRRSDKT